LLRSISGVTQSLNRAARHRVNHDPVQPTAQICQTQTLPG
jgi:hypothetical protein